MDEEFEDIEDEVIEEDDDDWASYGDDYAAMEDHLSRTRKIRYYPAEPLPSLRQRLAYFVYEKRLQTFWQRLRATCLDYVGEDGNKRERLLSLWIDGKFYMFKPLSFCQEIPEPHVMEHMGRSIRFASGPPKYVLALKVLGRNSADRLQKYKDLQEFYNKCRADWRAAFIDICGMSFYIESLLGSFLYGGHDMEADLSLALHLEHAYGKHRELRKAERENRERFRQYKTRESMTWPLT